MLARFVEHFGMCRWHSGICGRPQVCSEFALVASQLRSSGELLCPTIVLHLPCASLSIVPGLSYNFHLRLASFSRLLAAVPRARSSYNSYIYWSMLIWVLIELSFSSLSFSLLRSTAVNLFDYGYSFIDIYLYKNEFNNWHNSLLFTLLYIPNFDSLSVKFFELCWYLRYSSVFRSDLANIN